MLCKVGFCTSCFAAFCLVADFLLPVLISLLFLLLYPIVRALEKITWGRDRRMPSAVAVLLSFVIFLLFMSAALQILMVPLVTQVNTLTKALPGFAAQVSATMNWFFGPEARAALPANVQALINEALTTAGRKRHGPFPGPHFVDFSRGRFHGEYGPCSFLDFLFPEGLADPKGHGCQSLSL